MSRTMKMDAIENDASSNMARPEQPGVAYPYLTPEDRLASQRTINTAWRNLIDLHYIQPERGI